MPELTIEGTVTDLTRGVYRRQYCGYIKGTRINATSIEAECWFWRFNSATDDFGNADADPSLMHAATVGRRKGVTVGQVARFYEECTGQDLLRAYEVAGEPFYHVTGFLVIQPAGKNGKRVRRVPPSPWDDDEIRVLYGRVNPSGIRVNPDSSSATHSETHPDPHSHTHPHAGEGVGWLLRKAGVKGWKQCVGVPGLNDAEVLLLIEDAKASKIRDAGGWIFNAITNGFDPAGHITVTTACRWAREGKLRAVNGNEVSGHLGNKGKFLVIGAIEIPEKQLLTSDIKIRTEAFK